MYVNYDILRTRMEGNQPAARDELDNRADNGSRPYSDYPTISNEEPV